MGHILSSASEPQARALSAADAAPSLLRRALNLIRPSRRVSQAELMATLNEVADAVSSAMSVPDVLNVIIERAKRITDTEKAVLILTDEHTGGLDLDSIVVRGRRDQHDQHWWEARLQELAGRIFVSGEPILEEHPQHGAILLCSPVLVKNYPIGLIAAINTINRPFSQDQKDYLSILSAFAASAIENARLAEQSRYVLLASERDRIAREMHDGVVQSLFSISLGLEVCKKQVYTDQQACAGRIDELQQHLNSSMGELRRFIYDLRPAKLTELGLVGAVQYWVREVTMGRPVHGRVSVEGEEPRLTPSEEACLYRVIKESVSNVVRHSGAEDFEVRLRFKPQMVHVEIEDGGIGFDPAKVTDGRAEQIGLRSIRQRVDREGGRFVVESNPGQGTTVIVDLPLEVSR